MRSPGFTHLTRATFRAGVLLVTGLFHAGTAASAADVCPDRGELRDRPVHSFPMGVAHDAPFDTAAGCPTWRWVGLQRDNATACPVPETAAGGIGWRVRPLFAEDAQTADEAHRVFETLPGGLRSFCVYSTDHTEPSLRHQLDRNLTRLLERGALLGVQSGCAAVAPMAGAQPNLELEPLKAQFYSRAGSLRSAGLTGRGGASGMDDPKVRLTFVDTQPSGRLADIQPSPFPNSPHGLALMRLAEGLICEEESSGCHAEITAALGLPVVSFDVHSYAATEIDPHRGGHFGTIDQIAQGVWDALGSWASSDQEHLVLNLSVAWVGEHYGGLEPEVRNMPLSVQALYRALEVASCSGALIVAAAGNNVGGPEIETGPLLPAAWERRPAPTERQCAVIESKVSSYRALVSQDIRLPDRLETPAPVSDFPSGVEPLIYAAAGVHADGVPLVNARPNSEPPRVAFADHAAVSEVREVGYPAVLTGSSLGAIVVSAAAAAIWNQLSGLDRSQVMSLVDNSGKTVPRQADFYLGDASGTPAPAVREIQVCRALSHALSRHGSSAVPTCGDPVIISRSPTDPMSCQPIGIENHSVQQQHAFCERQTVLMGIAPTPNQDPCPFRQYTGVCARPWGCPQPGGNPCIYCPLSPPPPDPFAAPTEPPTRSLSIQIDPEWKPELLSMTLGIGDYRFPLPADFKKYDCFQVTGIPAHYLEAQNGVLPMTALYFNSSKGSIESPVYFDR